MKRSLKELRLNDPLRMAGATAFFATFALPPILIIIIQLLGLFVNPNKVSSELIDRLSNVLGNTSAQQIKITLEAFRSLGQNWYVTLLGFVFLMFVATTLFAVIKNSLDQIWNIGIRPHAGVVFKLKSRLRSLIIILLAGILFFIGVVTEGLQVFLGNYIEDLWPGAGIFASRAVNEIMFIIIVTIWFTTLFRFLTAGRPKWQLAFAGGFFTAILFTAGKIIVRYMLALSKIGTIYGASGSIVLIMLFVFYSALIFYYGGCFVKILSDVYDKPIRPVKKAFTFELLEIDPLK
ncbi:YihY/virulence factor BrkB family protein [Daejeonella oryzae]|uniref:YihY/virulence factor BrkB family protein n=1 Tax=Daejeonella oryzae TaxID=1122943 RepID=UPI00041D2C0C|nr:YihY/virulence factor BrkB family protein [Daejeonella oryzae]